MRGLGLADGLSDDEDAVSREESWGVGGSGVKGEELEGLGGECEDSSVGWKADWGRPLSVAEESCDG